MGATERSYKTTSSEHEPSLGYFPDGKWLLLSIFSTISDFNATGSVCERIPILKVKFH
jgi:hypothetical protein